MLKVQITDTSLDQDVRLRIAARALMIKDNKVGVLYSKKYDFYLTPGGGVEGNETLMETCIRECLEETGILVKPLKQIVSLDANYPRIHIIHNYFICEVIEDRNNVDWTVQEKDQNLELKWLSLEEAKHAFSTYSGNIKYDAWMQREAVVISELRNYLKV